MDSYTVTALSKGLNPWGIYKNEIIGLDKNYHLVIGKDVIVLPFKPAPSGIASLYSQYFTKPVSLKMSFNDNSNVICVWMESTDKIEWCFVKDRTIFYQNSIVPNKSTTSVIPSAPSVSPLLKASGLYNGMFGIQGSGVWEYDKMVQDKFDFHLDGITADGQVVYHDDNIIYKGSTVYYQCQPQSTSAKSNYANVLVNEDVIAFALNSTSEVYIGFDKLVEQAKKIDCFHGDNIMLDGRVYNYKMKTFQDCYLVPDAKSTDKLVVKNNILYRSFGDIICKLAKNQQPCSSSSSLFPSYIA